MTDFARKFTESAVCVASSLSGAYAVMAAQQAEFAELVFVCPTAETMPEWRVWLRLLLRSRLVGEMLFNLLVSKPSLSLRYFERDHGVADPSSTHRGVHRLSLVDDPSAGCVLRAGFVHERISRPRHRPRRALADLDIPVKIVWSHEADLLGLERGRQLTEAVDAELVVIDDAKLLPHVEHPEEFIEAVGGVIADSP